MLLVDHSIYRMAKGAIGHLVVAGKENLQVAPAKENKRALIQAG